VSHGFLGALTLQIPWSNLGGKPVKVFIEDIYLIATPNLHEDYDEDAERKKKQQVKEEKLDSSEVMHQQNEAHEDAGKSQGFAESVVTKIIDNLQISVKNIHIRYEDSTSNPGVSSIVA